MNSRTVLTKDCWVREAMEVLRARGVGGVRVLSLAQSLGVTRGSFYWHFRDRQDLLDCMLDWWDREMTDSVIGYIDPIRGGVYKRVLALAEFVMREDMNRYDLAMRSWAQGDRRVAAVVRRVTQKRLVYVTGLFQDAGFSPATAETRGHLLAIYVMSEGAVHAGESLQTRLRFLRRHVRSLTKRT